MKLNKTLKLKFNLMFFDRVYPTRPSDTVAKYTIYLSILLVGRFFFLGLVLGLILLLYPMASKMWLKMPCTLLCEIEYSLEFVSVNLPFSSRPSDTKIQAAFICWYLQQKSQKFENVLLWASIF